MARPIKKLEIKITSVPTREEMKVFWPEETASMNKRTMMTQKKNISNHQQFLTGNKELDSAKTIRKKIQKPEENEIKNMFK